MPNINQYMTPAEYTPKSMFAALPLELMQQNLQRKQEEIDSTLAAAYKIGKGFDAAGVSSMKGIDYEKDANGQYVDYNPDPNKNVPGYQPMYKAVYKDFNVAPASSQYTDMINEDIDTQTSDIVNKIMADKLNASKYMGDIQNLYQKKKKYSSSIDKIKLQEERYNTIKQMQEKEADPTQWQRAYQDIGDWGNIAEKVSGMSKEEKMNYLSNLPDLNISGATKYYDYKKETLDQAKGFQESGQSIGLSVNPVTGFYSYGSVKGVKDSRVRNFVQNTLSTKDAVDQMKKGYTQSMLDYGMSPVDFKYEDVIERDKSGKPTKTKTYNGFQAYYLNEVDKISDAAVSREAGELPDMHYAHFNAKAEKLAGMMIDEMEKPQGMPSFADEASTNSSTLSSSYKENSPLKVKFDPKTGEIIGYDNEYAQSLMDGKSYTGSENPGLWGTAGGAIGLWLETKTDKYKYEKGKEQIAMKAYLLDVKKKAKDIQSQYYQKTGTNITPKQAMEVLAQKNGIQEAITNRGWDLVGDAPMQYKKDFIQHANERNIFEFKDGMWVEVSDPGNKEDIISEMRVDMTAEGSTNKAPSKLYFNNGLGNIGNNGVNVIAEYQMGDKRYGYTLSQEENQDAQMGKYYGELMKQSQNNPSARLIRVKDPNGQRGDLFIVAKNAQDQEQQLMNAFGIKDKKQLENIKAFTTVTTFDDFGNTHIDKKSGKVIDYSQNFNEEDYIYDNKTKKFISNKSTRPYMDVMYDVSGRLQDPGVQTPNVEQGLFKGSDKSYGLDPKWLMKQQLLLGTE